MTFHNHAEPKSEKTSPPLVLHAELKSENKSSPPFQIHAELKSEKPSTAGPWARIHKHAAAQMSIEELSRPSPRPSRRVTPAHPAVTTPEPLVMTEETLRQHISSLRKTSSSYRASYEEASSYSPTSAPSSSVSSLEPTPLPPASSTTIATPATPSLPHPLGAVLEGHASTPHSQEDRSNHRTSACFDAGAPVEDAVSDSPSKLASELTSKLSVGTLPSGISAKLERARTHRKRAERFAYDRRYTDGEFTWAEGGGSDTCSSVGGDADEEAELSAARQRRGSQGDLAEVFTKAASAFVPRGPSPAESGTRTPVYIERVPDAGPQHSPAEQLRRRIMPNPVSVSSASSLAAQVAEAATKRRMSSEDDFSSHASHASLGTPALHSAAETLQPPRRIMPNPVSVSSASSLAAQVAEAAMQRRKSSGDDLSSPLSPGSAGLSV